MEIPWLTPVATSLFPGANAKQSIESSKGSVWTLVSPLAQCRKEVRPSIMPTPRYSLSHESAIDRQGAGKSVLHTVSQVSQCKATMHKPTFATTSDRVGHNSNDLI